MTTFNATMGALASRQHDLSTTISLLPPLLRTADSALGPLQASFGPTQPFAAELTPASATGADDHRRPPVAASGNAADVPGRTRSGLLASLTPAVQGTSATLTASKALLTGPTRWPHAS